MVIDPIANLINGIKNASLQGASTVSLPYSKVKHSILEVLKKEGYIEDFEKKGKDIKKRLNVNLKYTEGDPVIKEVKRVSKQSQRIYKSVKDIHPVKNGYGMMVLSTPEGVMSDNEARKRRVGGEALFKVW